MKTPAQSEHRRWIQIIIRERSFVLLSPGKMPELRNEAEEEIAKSCEVGIMNVIMWKCGVKFVTTSAPSLTSRLSVMKDFLGFSLYPLRREGGWNAHGGREKSRKMKNNFHSSKQ